LEIESLSAGQPITVGELTILPIIRVYIGCQNTDFLIVGSASKRPVAIVVISPQEKHALNLDGEEVPLEQYAEVREVKKLLEN
jgi:uncharacterized spore protein YtfJ